MYVCARSRGMRVGPSFHDHSKSRNTRRVVLLPLAGSGHLTGCPPTACHRLGKACAHVRESTLQRAQIRHSRDPPDTRQSAPVTPVHIQMRRSADEQACPQASRPEEEGSEPRSQAERLTPASLPRRGPHVTTTARHLPSRRGCRAVVISGQREWFYVGWPGSIRMVVMRATIAERSDSGATARGVTRRIRPLTA